MLDARALATGSRSPVLDPCMVDRNVTHIVQVLMVAKTRFARPRPDLPSAAFRSCRSSVHHSIGRNPYNHRGNHESII